MTLGTWGQRLNNRILVSNGSLADTSNNHGGLSTGPRTAEGIERIRRAVTKHGNFTKRAKAERAEYRALLRACREILAGL